MSYIASMDARTRVEKARFLFRLGAPFALIFFICARIYLESIPYALYPNFNYYRSLHMFFWYLNPFLLGYFTGCVLGRLHPVNFMWGGYAMAVLLLPIGWAVVTGNYLNLDYHSGTPDQIIKDIFSFVATAPHNHPVILDGGVAFLGMIGMGYFYSRRWPRTMLMAILSFFIINYFATLWIGSPEMSRAIVHIPSRLTNHPFLAAQRVTENFFITLLVFWKAEFFRQDGRLWLFSGMVGLGAWILYVSLALAMGWFGDSLFDSIVTGLPIGACIFLLVRVILWIAGHEGHPLVLVGFAWLLVGQFLVMGPIYLGKESLLTRDVITMWKADPFAHMQLVDKETFPVLMGPANGFAAIDRTRPHLQFESAPWLLPSAPGGPDL